MDFALIASATLLGLAGAPHCAVMCSVPCAAAVGTGGAPARTVFHLSRIVSYTVGGAVVASSVSALASWSALSPALRPLWVLLNAALLVLGLWLLLKGRQPPWLARLGRVPPSLNRGTWQRIAGPARAATTGAFWIAWPCGLLQSALLVASLTGSAGSGAAAMFGFAVASAPGLLFGPWVVARLLRGAEARERWAARAAGVLLVAASGWALGHGIWPQVAALCRGLMF